MGNIVAKFDIDKLFAGVYEAVDIITATVVDAMQMACFCLLYTSDAADE